MPGPDKRLIDREKLAMPLQLEFIYYRSFRFDGLFHVRCVGPDLPKVNRIRYELERVEPGRAVAFNGVSTYSKAASGKLCDQGCQATLTAERVAGTYRIRPRVVLMDSAAMALGRPTGAAGVFDLEPLVIDIDEREMSRAILDTLPLDGSAPRRKRALTDSPGTRVDDPWGAGQPAFPLLPEGRRYPPVTLKFRPGGLALFLQHLEAGADALLARKWPGLKPLIEPRPYLVGDERHSEALEVLREYCSIRQPPSMSNASFVELLKTLAALDYLETLHFQAPPPENGNLLVGAAALLATLITGAAVKAGNHANEQARPTPDFEPQQKYLDAPIGFSKGLNIRKAWEKQVTGRGARIHFSDGGLHAEHEALRGKVNLQVVTAQPNDDPEHGTASLGVMLATRNGLGVTGISHDCELYLYDNRATQVGHPTTLKQLLSNVAPGDIVGINRQTANPGVLHTVLPSLHDRAWWDVCQALTQRGAVVLNAAANGSSTTDTQAGTTANYGVDLSQWRFFDDHGDAGTILVGACHSWDGKPHHYSNHGYRYRMLNAWGDSVVTLGYGDLQDKDGTDRDYTDRYAGTSSATPMVTGALCLIQSYALQQHHIYLDSDQMHLLVMASGYKDATLPDTDVLPMGARPDVHGALVLLDRILGGGRFHTPRDEL
ncbi:S8 family serine peptidase [Pseudomonas sp. NPDC089401]|uniref:S8 family serine peptidase n=1 Tax=Pseudomonas sp. NPDC089401 TaxID=3364462 RepID=UPI003808FB32